MLNGFMDKTFINETNNNIKKESNDYDYNYIKIMKLTDYNKTIELIQNQIFDRGKIITIYYNPKNGEKINLNIKNYDNYMVYDRGKNRKNYNKGDKMVVRR